MTIRPQEGGAVPRPTPTAEPPWTRRGEPAFRRINAALFVAGLATFSLLYCVQPLMPNFAEAFGVGAAQSSLSLSLSTGCLAFSILIAGGLSDRVGRKGVMATSLLTAAALNGIVAFAPNWPVLLVLRTLEGIALGGAPAVAMAYLAEEIHPGSLGFTMGLYVGGTAIGGMSGRVVTGLMAEYFGWRAAVGTIGLLGLVAAAGFLALLPPSRNFVSKERAGFFVQLKGLAAHLGHSALPWLFACGGLLMGAFVTLYNYAGFRLQAPPYDLDQAQSGAVFSLYAFGTLASTAAGAAADRFGRGPVLAICVALIGAGLAVTLAAPLVTVILGIALITLGFFAGHAVASGWVGRLAGAAKGQAASLYLLSYYLGSSILGSLGGVFWARGRWPAVAGFVAVLLVLLAIATARLWRWAATREPAGVRP